MATGILRTEGPRIVDADGNVVTLRGVSQSPLVLFHLIPVLLTSDGMIDRTWRLDAHGKLHERVSGS